VKKVFWVIGTGAWGMALAQYLVRQGYTVRVLGRDQKRCALLQKQYSVEVMASLGASVSMEYVVLAVPSGGVEEAVSRIRKHLRPNSEICSVAKGFVDGEIIPVFLNQHLERHVHYRAIGILSGPCFAASLEKGDFSALVLASDEESFLSCWQVFWHSSSFRVYWSRDVLGVSLGGVLKNIIAVAVGVADGYGLGVNAQSALITRGLVEMRRIAVASGALEETMMGLAGMGDLVLTATGSLSRNRRFGVLLGQGYGVNAALEKIGQVVESVSQMERVSQLAKEKAVEMPICEAMFAVVSGVLGPKEAIETLLHRPMPQEE
jgi:glycerol-3-phosphate dehydrogenase (NAD(P)+)